ncbi:hypothetical protein LPW26_15855 [Rhodopseudomonas sp. HC1]|uniref:hypothetical protein n=1 Tax=Rhodopseudomonas infernalis TaxID=2897386 RepID=UPI001EE840DA|nr:hypothetical protein [Rhodopseudomonas infernalis]MCG6206124.1 hypothetical protein [Rhodopseudomonas infernalis]
MDWASWSATADRILHSPNLSIYAALAAAVVFALILIIALLRADRSVANGVLGIVTLLAVGVAGFAGWRLFVEGASPAMRSTDASRSISAMPALACVDDLAGDAVQAACERALFGAPETIAAAVSYASTRLAQLTALGDVAAADKRMTPEIDRLRRSIERDRYGLVAYVLTAQDRCVPDNCAAFRSLTDHSRIAANMNEHLYELSVTRASASWQGATGGALAAAAAAAPEAPTGKPVNIDFATSSSIPPISIMTEPSSPAPRPPAAAAAPASAPAGQAAKRSPAAANAQAQAPAHSGQPAPAKRAPPKPKPAPAPVQLAPTQSNSDN